MASSRVTVSDRQAFAWLGRQVTKHYQPVLFVGFALFLAEVWAMSTYGAGLTGFGLFFFGIPTAATWFVISVIKWWNNRRILRARHRLPDPGLIATLNAFRIEKWRMFKITNRWKDFCNANNFTSKLTKQVPRFVELKASLEGDLEAFVMPAQMGIAASESKTPIERMIAMESALGEMCGCKVVMRRADNGVRIKFLWTDPLDRVLSIEQLPLSTTSKRIPVAVWESNSAASLDPNKSTLVYGVQGSGKSSLAWTYISVLLARQTPTDLYVVDPKSGQEWGWLRRLALAEDCCINLRGFANNEQEAIPLVKEALAQVKARQEKLGQFDLEDFSADPMRQHVPTAEEPYVLVLIDELLHVRSMLKDTPTNPSPVGQIISIGRSAAAAVVAVTQDPTKETVGMVRDLFGQRLCLRSATPQTTDMVLFAGAEASGAAASKIPEDKPGLCYFYDAESGSLSKARIAHVTDKHIKDDIQYGRAPRGMGVERGTRVRQREDGIYKFWGRLNALPPAWREWYTGSTAVLGMNGPGGGIVCLYVGHGLEPLDRMKDHAGLSGKPAKKWWDYVDHSLTNPPEWCANTAEALAYEQSEIKRLNPIGNEQHNKANPWRGRLELVAKPERHHLPSFWRRKSASAPVLEPVAASVAALSVKPDTAIPASYLAAARKPEVPSAYLSAGSQPVLVEQS